MTLSGCVCGVCVYVCVLLCVCVCVTLCVCVCEGDIHIVQQTDMLLQLYHCWWKGGLGLQNKAGVYHLAREAGKKENHVS